MEGVQKGLIYDEENDIVLIDPGNGIPYPAPGLDPRLNYHTEPRIGASRRCDAAANLSANFKGYIDDNIVALNLGASFAALVSLLFSRVPLLLEFSIALSLIEGAISAIMAAGASDLANQFTEEVYDRLTCYFYCAMDEDGRLDADTLQDVENDIFVNESTTVYNIMRVLFSQLGFGMVSDLATEGTLTGDCVSCSNCGDCSGVYDFGIDEQFWTIYDGRGGYLTSEHFYSIPAGSTDALTIRLACDGMTFNPNGITWEMWTSHACGFQVQTFRQSNNTLIRTLYTTGSLNTGGVWSTRIISSAGWSETEPFYLQLNGTIILAGEIRIRKVTVNP